MAEFKLGRLRFIWKNVWTTGTIYVKDDVIRNGGKTYVCVVGHTAAADFTTDLDNIPTRWNQVSDGSEWKDDWKTGTYYKLNDLVKYGGSLYICNTSHTSNGPDGNTPGQPQLLTGLAVDQANWDLYATSFDWLGEWTVETTYKVNDIVKYGGQTYVCNTEHESALTITLGLEDDQSKWDLYAESLDWKGDWLVATRYKVNDLVKYGGQTYVCNTGHTSASTETLGLEDDQGLWDYFHKGIEYKNTWNPSSIRYKINDVVKYGADLWICTTDHTSDTLFAEANWEQFVEGLEFESSWSDATVYQPGDVVTYGGFAYISKTNHTNKKPTFNPTDWDLFTTGFKLQGDWSNAVAYKVGDVVRVNGYTYTAIADNATTALTITAADATTDELTVADTTNLVAGLPITISGTAFGGVVSGTTYYVLNVVDETQFTITDTVGGTVEFALTTASGSMTGTTNTEPPFTPYWSRLNSGIEWQNVWADATDYKLGDAVKYGVNSYICVTVHTSQTSTRPDNDTVGAFWNMLTAGAEAAILTTTGDTLYYGGAGPTRLPVGATGQVLKIKGDVPVWEYFGVIDQVYYVAPSGVDSPAPTYGITLDKPWKTVRYAAEQVENGPKNLNVKNLLERNRSFIQKEIIGWIGQQILNDITPFTSSFTYDSTKCERDMGYIVDALVYDISHGGNERSRTAAVEYVTNAPAVYSLGQKEETVAAINYGLQVIKAVINNATPAELQQLVTTQVKDSSKIAELGADATLTGLVKIITDAITAGVTTNIPGTIRPNNTIFVKTGTYYEVLPIIIPRETAIVGDELRSTNIQPAPSYVAPEDVPFSLEALTRVGSVVADVVQNIAITKSATNALTQNTTRPAGTLASANAAAALVIDAVEYIDFHLNTVGTEPTLTGSNTPIATQAYYDAVAVLEENKDFLAEEAVAYIAANHFIYDEAKCSRDVGLIIDAVGYDLALGTNYNAVTAGLAYLRSYSAVVLAEQKTETLAGINVAKTDSLAAVTDSTSIARVTAAYDEIIDIITNGVANADVITFPGSSPDILQDKIDAKNLLVSNKAFMRAEVIAWINDTFPDLVYDEATCSRDAGYIIDALCYDVVYDGNSATVNAAKAYFFGAASQVPGQQTETVAAINHLKLIAQQIVQNITVTTFQLVETQVKDLANPASANEASSINGLCNIITDVITYGSSAAPAVSYPTISWATTAIANDRSGLLAVKTTIQAAVISYINTTYSAYSYDLVACKRDVRALIDAVKHDLIYTGNYKTLLAARYYRNAQESSIQEDMFYVRNGTGLRNMTIQGLSGSLGTNNAYGTKRPSAGAFVSLDPGWGPADNKVWIINKSPYVQNVTTFGTGCVGLKIDGALHNSGNRSVVANDFTQILSDGIGVWCTNLALTELVSVFSYYGHIGYLAENGGKIRATNGNSSYGTFGCVSEFVDSTEVPITSVVDNRAFEANITNVITDNSRVLSLEFANAGMDYNTATYNIFGAGINAAATADEFRDRATYEVRVTDNGNTVGGEGYITASNVAQGGTTTQITLAATDAALSSAYVGMRIMITAGAGVGQFGYITAYNNGSKIAQVSKDSTGTAGWDHVIPGTPIVSSLDLTTSYTIEPRLTFTSPTFSIATTSITSATWNDVVYGEYRNTYTAVAATDFGPGQNATFNVTKYGLKYDVTLNAGGVNYEVGNTLVIAGTLLGGASPTNDITLTVTGINTANGAITYFTSTGTGNGGVFVAIASDSTTTRVSRDGTTWSNGAQQIISNAYRVAYGVINGQSVWAAVNVTSNSSFSTEPEATGVNWTTATLPGSGFWKIAFGGDRFLAINTSSTTVAYSTDGATWTTGGALPASCTDVTYGAGRWVAVASGSDAGAYSTNGGVTWTAMTQARSGGSNAVTYGNNRFVAVGGSNSAQYSFDGITWYETTTISGSTLSWSRVRYGQGLFTATVGGQTRFATSEDGVTWTERAFLVSRTWSGLAFGNPGGIGTWVAVAQTTTDAARFTGGATTRARAKVTDEKVIEIRIVEPGSGYSSTPTMTITDPNNTVEVAWLVRQGNGVLANPSFSNRGTLYTTASATVSGNGYSDIYQPGTYLNVSGLTANPTPGSNIEIDGIDGYYKLVNVRNFLGTGPYTARFQVSPPLTIANAPAHGAAMTMRIKYSQVRLTGHDFLSIGTGNFAQTNYPGLPLQAADAEKETVESGGGRVFYTSTDQDGNFRVGTLFSIEQATGVATLNADAFNIAGLNELTLGAVALGGTGATVTEFSTDPFFTANSDSIIPTQRAIKAYINSQIGGGGSQLNVNTLTAGVIYIATNEITTTTGVQINVNSKMNFTGGVDGVPVAMNFFLLG